MRVGVIGLGTGALAVYGNAGDALFSYLRDTAAATETVLGDARLRLEREPNQQFDVLAVDASSSDAIPVHRLTTEAVALYLRLLRGPNGVLALHITNRFLDLQPVVGALAQHFGLASRVIESESGEHLSGSTWALLTRGDALTRTPDLTAAARDASLPADHLWRNDYSDLFCIVKWRAALRLPLPASGTTLRPAHPIVPVMNHLDKLLAGFDRFRRRYYHDQPALFEQLRHGQEPHVLVVACCDSRVHPDVITDSRPGELFVVRNIANLVPPFEEGGQYHGTSAAIEFAVCGLNVEDVVVLGHARCGGIQALLNGKGVTGGSGFVEHWMAIMQDARDGVLRQPPASTEAAARALEMAAVRISMNNLMTFPWIKARVDAGNLRLHGWYFDLEVGDLLGVNAASGRFAPLLPR